MREVKSRLAGLEREKTDANLLWTPIEENFNWLQTELKGVCCAYCIPEFVVVNSPRSSVCVRVALKELSSEYTSLKREQGSREDWSNTLTLLRVRYDDIRAKVNCLFSAKIGKSYPYVYQFR